MSSAFLTLAAGWTALILIVFEISIPYLFRRDRMWPHYWAGGLLPLLSFVHGWIPMQARQMRGVNGTGLWFATAALLFMLLQIAFGVALKGSHSPARSRIRAWHFRLMIVLTVCVAAHVWLN